MRRIKDCTLIAIDTINPGAAIASLKKSMAQCEFDEVIMFTNVDIRPDGIRVVLIPELKSNGRRFSSSRSQELEIYWFKNGTTNRMVTTTKTTTTTRAMINSLVRFC